MKSKKLLKIKYHKPQLIHAVVSCSECNFSESNYRNAVSEARKHAYETGHCVTVETGYFQIYNDKGNNGEKDK